MDTTLPNDWAPWRAASPLAGRRPTPEELADATNNHQTLDDVLPYPTDELNAGLLRLLIVGTNPSPWAAAVQAPFARPGNRFWKSLHTAGVTPTLVRNAHGMSRDDELMLAQRGIGITNIVSRPTSRSSELSRQELHNGYQRLTLRVQTLCPGIVAFTGITAFRTAFQSPQAVLGEQPIDTLDGWPNHIPLWVVPDPSGLNAHESVESLADKWTHVWAEALKTSCQEG